ncbi:MAG: hypothetical protein WDM81_20440 [Rhizomicrobium sp.]
MTDLSRAIWDSRTCALSMARTSSASSFLSWNLLTPTHHVLAAVDARLAPRRGFLDAQLGDAGLDRFGHAAHRLDLVDDRLRGVGQRMGQRLDIVRAAERIDHLGDLAFVLQDELRVARDAGGELGRQRDGLVEGIGVQRLGAPNTDARASIVVRTTLL